MEINVTDENYEGRVYEVMVMCRNCNAGSSQHGGNILIVVPYGEPLKPFLREITCENCGCDGFMGIL